MENTKEVGNARDNRGKAKQFTTLNGRTVVVKESFVYSNKGVLPSRTHRNTLCTKHAYRLSQPKPSTAID